MKRTIMQNHRFYHAAGVVMVMMMMMIAAGGLIGQSSAQLLLNNSEESNTPSLSSSSSSSSSSYSDSSPLNAPPSYLRGGSSSSYPMDFDDVDENKQRPISYVSDDFSPRFRRFDVEGSGVGCDSSNRLDGGEEEVSESTPNCRWDYWNRQPLTFSSGLPETSFTYYPPPSFNSGDFYHHHAGEMLGSIRHTSPLMQNELPKSMGDHFACESDPTPMTMPLMFHAVYRLDSVPGHVRVHYYYDYQQQRTMTIVIPKPPGMDGAIEPYEGSFDVDTNMDRNYYDEVNYSPKQSESPFVSDGGGEEEGENGPSHMRDMPYDRADPFAFPPQALWMYEKGKNLWVFNRRADVCRYRPLPHTVIPPPDYLKNAKFIGQRSCCTQGGKCNVFVMGRGPAPYDDKPFLTYFENAEHKIPVGYKFFNGLRMLVLKFVPGETLTPDYWKLPPSCPTSQIIGMGLGVDMGVSVMSEKIEQ